jgi:hypothetical protein
MLKKSFNSKTNGCRCREIEGLYRTEEKRAEGREPIRGREYGKGCGPIGSQRKNRVRIKHGPLVPQESVLQTELSIGPHPVPIFPSSDWLPSLSPCSSGPI